MNAAANETQKLLMDHRGDRELWLAYYSTIFKRFLFSAANIRELVDINIAAGIALEDIQRVEEKIFGQSAGSTSKDYLKQI